MTFAAIMCALAASNRARAVDATSDKVAAESLFREGRRLLERGDVAHACEKFAGSQRLDPAIGSLLNLAACEARLNRTASAWVHYREAEAMAHRVGDRRRERVANQRATELEPKLARLAIRPSDAAPPPAVAVITRDGATVEPALLGTPVPVDPGRHEIAVQAPGYLPWSKTVDAIAGETLDVPLAALERVKPSGLPAATASQTRAPVDPGAAALTETVPAQPSRTWRIVGWTALAVGVVGFTAGTLFALEARSKLDRAKAACGAAYATGVCSDERGVADNHASGVAADRATASFVVGAIGVVGGATLWWSGRF